MRKSLTMWAAVVVVAVTAGSADAFYFLGWPSGPKLPPTLLPPDPAFPSDPPRDALDPVGPGTDPPDVPGGGPPPTVTTPEPATALLAALGLTAVAAARRKRGR